MKKLLFSVSIIGVFCTPALAYAATLSFTADQTTIGIGNPFEIAVTLNTKNEVNAVGVAISIPSGLELIQTNNGNSAVSYWVEQPQFDAATRLLTFSGIMPNGLSGTRRLLVLTLKANALGTSTFSFDPVRTTLYQNGPQGTIEPTTIVSLSLQSVSEATNGLVPIIDTVSPEAFTPEVTRSTQLYDGAWTLVFETQDKGSGIAQYEVSESLVRAADPNTLSWTKAESPYRLVNQTPAKYIYVRAVDEQGNVRTELFTPSHQFSWLEGFMLGILTVALVLLVYWLRRGKHYHASE